MKSSLDMSIEQSNKNAKSLDKLDKKVIQNKLNINTKDEQIKDIYQEMETMK